MDRRGFLLWLAALPAFLGLRRAAPPVSPPPVVEALPEVALFTVTATEAFYRDSEIVAGILSVPLLDLLIADSVPVGRP